VSAELLHLDPGSRQFKLNCDGRGHTVRLTVPSILLPARHHHLLNTWIHIPLPSLRLRLPSATTTASAGKATPLRWRITTRELLGCSEPQEGRASGTAVSLTVSRPNTTTVFSKGCTPDSETTWLGNDLARKRPGSETTWLGNDLDRNDLDRKRPGSKTTWIETTWIGTTWLESTWLGNDLARKRPGSETTWIGTTWLESTWLGTDLARNRPGSKPTWIGNDRPGSNRPGSNQPTWFESTDLARITRPGSNRPGSNQPTWLEPAWLEPTWLITLIAWLEPTWLEPTDLALARTDTHIHT
jgi:hypothetical protein